MDGCLLMDGVRCCKKDLASVFVYCKRGVLVFKWNETDIKLSEILALAPYRPVFGHISGKRLNTHWICFIKDEYHNRKGQKGLQLSLFEKNE